MTNAVVTGANRGIGLGLTKALLKRGTQVVAACRSPSAQLLELAEKNPELKVVTDVDVATEEGVERLAAALHGDSIDLLINNAGILVWGDTLEDPKYGDIVRQFEVNALGPLRVTAALHSRLKSGSKVAFITSRMGSIADNTSGGSYGYRMSKAALNMAAMSMTHDLKSAGVSVIVLHPGMVKTEMIGMRGEFTPDEAAAGLLARIDELTPETSGKFFHQNGEELPW